MEDKVLEIIKYVFELDSVDTTFSQETCKKWDSLGQLNLIIELEDAFNVSFDPEEIAEMKSYNDIIRFLRSKMG